MAQVFPTKSNLMSTKKSLDLAKLGYDLLDRKRNILVHEMMQLIDKASKIQQEIDETYSKAYLALQRANVTLGMCAEFAQAIPVDASMFGVSLVAMNTFAFGIRCAGPFAAYGLGLAVPKATKNSGMISIFTGTIAFVVWQLLSNGGTLWFMMPVVFGSLVSVITFYVVNLIEWKRGVPAAPSAYAVEEAK